MSTISSVSGYSAAYTQSAQTTASRQRPDPATLAAELFSKLDTSGNGYLQKSDFESAFGQISGTSASTTSGTSSSTSADALFTAMDSDGDGKLTQTELSDTLTKLSQQLDSHFQQGRMHGAGGPPPGPPPGDDSDGDDQGMTADQLSAAASALASSDPNAASLMSTAAANFDKADSNGDGKVSFKEAMAYQQANVSTSANSSATLSPSTATSVASSSASATASDREMFGQLMKLLSAYGLTGPAGAATQNTLSVSA